MSSFNFVLIGAAGYIAPRHMKAIKDTGNELLAVYDPYDGIGILDTYFPKADYFREFERFERHIEKLKRKGVGIDYVSICSPNYLHDSHIRFGFRIGAHVICEKPIVLNLWNLDALIDLEQESEKRVFSILQLRLHPSIVKLKKEIELSNITSHYIELTYITARGNWYLHSWKGDKSKSGGIATNIGVHFFDMLAWIFGEMISYKIDYEDDKTMKGALSLTKASVSWILSIDDTLLPESCKQANQRTYRSILVDEKEIEFSEGFEELHTASYREIIAGKGYGLQDTRESIKIVSEIR